MQKEGGLGGGREPVLPSMHCSERSKVTTQIPHDVGYDVHTRPSPSRCRWASDRAFITSAYHCFRETYVRRFMEMILNCVLNLVARFGSVC